MVLFVILETPRAVLKRVGRTTIWVAAFIFCFVASGWETPALAGEPVNHCVSRVANDDNSIADFLENDCSFAVNVIWRDRGSCVNWCATSISAGRRQSVTPIRGLGSIGACRYPELPVVENQDSFRCQ